MLPLRGLLSCLLRAGLLLRAILRMLPGLFSCLLRARRLFPCRLLASLLVLRFAALLRALLLALLAFLLRAGLLLSIVLLSILLLTGLLISRLLLARLLQGGLLVSLLVSRLVSLRRAACLRRRRTPRLIAAIRVAAIRVGAPAVAAGPLALGRTVIVAMVDERLRRAALVVVVELRTVAAGVAHVAALHVGGRRVAVMARGQFARVRRAPDAIGATVVADASPINVVDDHGVVVHVGDARDVHVGHRAVVVEAVALPVAAHIPQAHIAEAVVDAAIKADVGPPITGIPHVQAIRVPPVSGRP